MTFHESDYVSLNKEMVNLIRKYKNPALVVEILQEMWEIHQQVPLYPGIITMCLPSMVQEKRIGELKKGQKVLIKTRDCEVLGAIKSIKGDRIILDNPEVMKQTKSIEVKGKEINKILVLEKDVLGKVWPTLVFEKPKTARTVKSKRKKKK